MAESWPPIADPQESARVKSRERSLSLLVRLNAAVTRGDFATAEALQAELDARDRASGYDRRKNTDRGHILQFGEVWCGNQVPPTDGRRKGRTARVASCHLPASAR